MEATQQEVVMSAMPSYTVLTVESINDPTSLTGCDRCGANALWRVMLTTGHDLAFCAHHAVKHGFAPAEHSHAAYREENRQQGSSS